VADYMGLEELRTGLVPVHAGGWIDSSRESVVTWRLSGTDAASARNRGDDLRSDVALSRSVESGDGWCLDACNTHSSTMMRASTSVLFALCCELRKVGRDMQVGLLSVGRTKTKPLRVNAARLRSGSSGEKATHEHARI
jgi:hypothetical protein